MLKGFIQVFLITIPLLAYSQERIVVVNGHKFAVYSKGLEHRQKGSPVVVFENGMGMGYENWDTVLEEIARFAPVFAYDRSGVEKSEKTYQMPTLRQTTENLRSLLLELKIPPPYILVGHSMGGVYIRGYAGFYPNEIAGLVFVDPADFTESKDDWNSIFRKLGVPDKKIDELINDRLYSKSAVDSANFAPWAEGQVLTELRRTDFAEIRQLPLPPVPICFLVGGRFGVPPEQWSKDFDHPKFFVIKSNGNMERWRKLIDAAPSGSSLVYLPDCGHYLHREDPGVVINTIQTMLKSLK